MTKKKQEFAGASNLPLSGIDAVLGLLLQSTDKAKNLLIKLLKENTQVVSPESINEYIQYAPQGAKEYFLTLSNNDKTHVMKHIEYKEDGIYFINDNGIIIEAMENENYQLDDSNDLHTVWNDEHFFHFDLIKNDEFVPTFRELEALIHLMPAKDYQGETKKSLAVKQLYLLLGCKFSEKYVTGGLNNENNEKGYLMTRSTCQRDTTGCSIYALQVFQDDNQHTALDRFNKTFKYPVRRRIDPARNYR